MPYRMTPSVRHRAIEVHYYYYYYYYIITSWQIVDVCKSDKSERTLLGIVVTCAPLKLCVSMV